MAAELIRLRHKGNGVVVNVDEETAERLGAGAWEPFDGKVSEGKPAKETAAQKRKREADEKAEREAVEAWLAAEREFVESGGTAGGE